MDFSTLTASELDRVRPLWLDHHAQHFINACDSGPFLNAEASWRQRRKLYEACLASGGAVVVAHSRGADHGYAAWRPARMPWPATLNVAPHLAELTVLVVRRDRMGTGIDATLAARVEAMAAASGFGNSLVSVVSSNEEAIAFYRNRGFTPVWTILSRFDAGTPALESDDGIAVLQVPPHEVEDLRIFCDALHDHHRLVAGHLAPFVSHDQSWAVFSPYFRASAERGLVLRVGRREAPLGMVCATQLSNASMFTGTWILSGDVAEIEVLAVAERARGRGLGKRLMQAMGARLHELGIRNQLLGAFEPNHDAVRFYLGIGFAPAVLQLAKFGAGR